MVNFTTESRRVLTAVNIINISLYTISLLIALHNTIKYLCKPRSNKLLINSFYFIMITALIFSILNCIYMLVESDNIFI